MQKLFSLLLFIYTLTLLFVSTTIAHNHDEESDPGFVTCGSVVKLRNAKANHRLHSHKVTYGSGSGQQSVTAISDVDDPNSLWLIKGPHGSACKTGAPIKKGESIRLQHVLTTHFLHSHLHASPISRQQEVSCYSAANNEGDSGDNWQVHFSGESWKRTDRVRLIHDDTGRFLSTSVAHKFGHPIPGQLEVAAVSSADPTTEWVTEEGFYFVAQKD